MKVVLNKEYGGFGYRVAEQFEKWVRNLENERTNPELIKFVETQPSNCGDLAIVEIPDNSTDWLINEEDGCETLFYVVDGKICQE